MKLRYDSLCLSHKGMVLVDEYASRRIELYVSSNGDGATYSLISLAGAVEDHQPDRKKSMGPFHGQAMALGAANAVVAALRDLGFHQTERIAIWSIPAAAEAREIRRERNLQRIDCSFIPLGIPPERPN